MTSDHGAVHHHAHHFASADDEFEACKQGMWVFMVTEVLMFGGLFVAYGIFRGLYPAMFHAAHLELKVSMGALNTAVLITSSLTMALSVSSTQKGRRDQAILYLVVTFLLASCFLVVKYFEYTEKFHHHLLPVGLLPNDGSGSADSLFKALKDSFNPELLGEHGNSNLFFGLYFIMTGLHGLHVMIGMGLIAWLLIRTRRNDFSPEFYTPVELVGFYWHFVDLVWIYLFPLLYLVG